MTLVSYTKGWVTHELHTLTDFLKYPCHFRTITWCPMVTVQDQPCWRANTRLILVCMLPMLSIRCLNDIYVLPACWYKFVYYFEKYSRESHISPVLFLILQFFSLLYYKWEYQLHLRDNFPSHLLLVCYTNILICFCKYLWG